MKHDITFLILALIVGTIPEVLHGDTNAVFTAKSNGVFLMTIFVDAPSSTETPIKMETEDYVWSEGWDESTTHFKVNKIGRYQIQVPITLQGIEPPWWLPICKVVLKILVASVWASLIFHFTRSLWRGRRERSS